jgi:hypothetical protein
MILREQPSQERSILESLKQRYATETARGLNEEENEFAAKTVRKGRIPS